MQTLDRVLHRGARETHQIELPFAGLTRLGFGLAKGTVSMIASGPGVGKSAWALQVANRLDLPTYYASADTDSWTVTVRALANASGHPQAYIQSVLKGSYDEDFLDIALHQLRHIQFSFDVHTIRQVNDDLLAYGVIYGAYPQLVVVDNLRNFARDGDNEVTAQQRAMDDFHDLASKTGAHVMVLHHAQGKYHSGDVAVPLDGIENKVTHLPASVLTLHRRDPHVFACPVKNRLGKSDPSAKTQVRLRFDGERQTYLED